MDIMINDTTEIEQKIVPDTEAIPDLEDYAPILRKAGVKYRRTTYYLEVGEPEWIFGWILEISVIQTHLPALMAAVVPVLIEEGVCFKMPTSARKARAIISGDIGSFILGKVICVFPREGRHAMELAKKLIQVTRDLKGPKIPTSRWLGGAIYTRYGAGKIDALRRERLTIPFFYPKGIQWPFLGITPPKALTMDTILQDRYKPIFLLKDDPKGTVRKGLWLNKKTLLKWCVIKEGRRHMTSDLQGRDMVDRMRWQHQLHKGLEGIVPLPIIYDHFEENGDGYLVMEYIRGISLLDKIEKVFGEMAWHCLPLTERSFLLDYTLQVLEIIGTMHERGYIHRDITSSNFLVDKNNLLCMIDLELTYCLNSNQPCPPFRLGTPGFMSPEQEQSLPPTVAQDLYAIGALLVNVLTGLPPIHFVQKEKSVLKSQLAFFISEPVLIDLIGDCFSVEPAQRPGISVLKSAIENFKKRQTVAIAPSAKFRQFSIQKEEELVFFISRAIDGLTGPSVTNDKKLWISRGFVADGTDAELVKPAALNIGFCEGISGIVWLLSRAYSLGFSIDVFKEMCEAGISFIRSQASHEEVDTPGGLYSGAAGLAIAISSGVCNGVISDSDEIRSELIKWIGNTNIEGCGVFNGLAGQGLALLHAAPLVGDDIVKPLIEEKVRLLLKEQQKDGSWIALTLKNKNQVKPTGFGHGAAGIVCFLLCYLKQYGYNAAVEEASVKAMKWLLRQGSRKNGVIYWPISNKTNRCSLDFQDGLMGIILSLVKAYEIFQNTNWKELAIECLGLYAHYPVSRILTLGTGLVGYGEVILEAAKIFNDGHLKERVDWIAQFLVHYYMQEEGKGWYWIADGSAFPTAGLWAGNSGLLHFLLRYYRPSAMSHPMLSC